MSRQRGIRCGCVLFVLGTALASQAQEPAGPHLTGSLGSVTVGDEQFYRMSFRPEIPLGPWGVALDLELFLDQQGGISSRGWEFGTATETVSSLLRKIYYVRYGRPHEEIYAKVGALDNVTLGYGLILADYRNTLEYPGIKKTGLEFKLRNLGGSGIGVEGMVNNVQDFQQGGPVVGLRAFGQVLGPLELGISYVTDVDQYGGLLDSDDDGFPDAVDAFPDDEDRALDNDGDGQPDELDLDDDNNGAVDADAGSGLSAALQQRLRDLNTEFGPAFPVDTQVQRRTPFNDERVDRDPFSMVGLDAAYPITRSAQLTVSLYGQVALIADDDDDLDPQVAVSQGVQPGNRKAKGWGLAAPGVLVRTGPLTAQLEFRRFAEDFEARHFDNLYEVDRVRIDPATGLAQPKDARLGRSESVAGVYGHAATDLGQLVLASASYQYLTGADDPEQYLIASAALSEEVLGRVPRLTLARAYYQKENIGRGLNEEGEQGSSDGFFEPTEDMLYGYEIGLEMSGGVSLVWDTRYVFERGADRDLDRRQITSIQTVFVF
ncbi:MAG: hypothetical protein AB1505_32515 [Candidatus Latescibacterota bacterium]